MLETFEINFCLKDDQIARVDKCNKCISPSLFEKKFV